MGWKTRSTIKFIQLKESKSIFVFLNKIVNTLAMLVERTNNKIVITVSSSVDDFGVQRLIDYAKYLEATANSKAKQADADALAEEVNASWWENNKGRFAK